MKSIIQKKIMSARTKFQEEKFPQYLSIAFNKVVDHVKSEVRSSHNISEDCLRTVFSVSFPAVVSRTKTVTNLRVCLIKSELNGRIEKKLFQKFSLEEENHITWDLI